MITQWILSSTSDSIPWYCFLSLGWTGPYVSRSCKIESFPSRLITRPLPSDKLNEVLFPVPREGVEMQMHVYPDDWHSIVLPQHCV
ncbi:hypothetical protein EB796_004943 [Bugula neritina]|uniref:Uncharacterized protein n=1 Tax=Bugula neritina TaxID=10212 RepID=A0A7J7KEW8_BUGNE|nr:hypothetical protein EB796_004943 [Bugula neritina]